MSKEYYRKRIVDLRASVAREKEAKKRDNEYYARQIKGTKSTSAKQLTEETKLSVQLRTTVP